MVVFSFRKSLISLALLVFLNGTSTLAGNLLKKAACAGACLRFGSEAFPIPWSFGTPDFSSTHPPGTRIYRVSRAEEDKATFNFFNDVWECRIANGGTAAASKVCYDGTFPSWEKSDGFVPRGWQEPTPLETETATCVFNQKGGASFRAKLDKCRSLGEGKEVSIWSRTPEMQRRIDSLAGRDLEAEWKNAPEYDCVEDPRCPLQKCCVEDPDAPGELAVV